MKISVLGTAVVAYVLTCHPSPAMAQVDQQRAREYFKEARVLCERASGAAIAALSAAESGASFIRTFAYASGAGYGLLLDALSPG
jgi:hypothetical protein